MAAVPEERWLESMHVVRRDGTVRSAGDAVIELMAMSWRTRPVAWLARLLPPLRRRISKSYEELASRRGELSEKVPDVPETIDPPTVL